MYMTNVITFAPGIQGVPNGVQASTAIHYSNTVHLRCAFRDLAAGRSPSKQSRSLFQKVILNSIRPDTFVKTAN